MNDTIENPVEDEDQDTLEDGATDAAPCGREWRTEGTATATPLADAPAHLAREIGDLRKVDADLAARLSEAAAAAREILEMKAQPSPNLAQVLDALPGRAVFGPRDGDEVAKEIERVRDLLRAGSDVHVTDRHVLAALLRSDVKARNTISHLTKIARGCTNTLREHLGRPFVEATGGPFHPADGDAGPPVHLTGAEASLLLHGRRARVRALALQLRDVRTHLLYIERIRARLPRELSAGDLFREDLPSTLPGDEEISSAPTNEAFTAHVFGEEAAARIAAAHRRIRAASDPVDGEPEVIDHFSFGPDVPSNEVEPDLLRRTRGRREGQQ